MGPDSMSLDLLVAFLREIVFLTGFFFETFFFEIFFLAAGFFFDPALSPATFFLVTFCFTPAVFLVMTGFLLAAFFRGALAGLRFLLAVFFAGIFFAPAGPRKTRNYTLPGWTWKD